MSSDPLPLDIFIELSAALTGVAADQLKSEIDSPGLADHYFATVNRHIGAATLAKLTSTFQTTGNPVQAAGIILADPVLDPVARSIMKLWLLGIWYDPFTAQPTPTVVSAQSYKESLIWKIMQSHPIGYSMFTFGYWAKPPPPLKRFVQLASNRPKTTPPFSSLPVPFPAPVLVK